MKNNLYLTLLLLIVPVLFVSAQENLPYTRFALGDLRTTSTAEQKAWGGLDAAFQDETSFDITNPASLASLKLTVFQAGLYGRVTQIKSFEGKDDFGYTSPAYLMLGVPVAKNWGISFGLLPYSTVSYNIFQDNVSGNGLPNTENEFIGTGSTYQVYLASAWAIKGLSFGVSGAYLFGSLNNNSQQLFADTLNGFNTNYQIQRSLRAFVWNAGLQYDFVIKKTDIKTGLVKKENDIVFGICGHSNINANARQNYVFNRFYYSTADGTQVPYDTIALGNNQKGTIIIPTIINAGIVWKHKDKLKVGFNYTYNNYKAYKSFDTADSTCNSYMLSAGAEYTPHFDNTGDVEYYKRIAYRIGAYYGNYFLSFDNKPLLNYGLTFGVGLPLKRLFSGLDLAFDVGSLGTTENNLVKETYVRGTLGIRFSDKWFIKRKYD